MKLAIIGHGRMGTMIEEIARSRGHHINCIIDVDSIEAFESEEFRSCDAAIEFTTPSTAVGNILKCFAAGIPVVCGTTGWIDSLPELHQLCNEGKGTLMHSSNFSIGVNIFRAVNRYLARIMQSFPEYHPEMTETHHIHKLDHPSGTAITLAEEIVASNSLIQGWKEPTEGETLKEDILPIGHIRRGEVPGIHTIKWDSNVDYIEMTHSAKSRQGFALGAVMAAEWIKGRKGFFTIGEMLSQITDTTDVFE
ncbi:MAG: 4-hydroxy-tetrahydrodipicolinate reductase [Clostridium sp.]|nr:4-hydroxy-tetrahydrodipicolinate reductase [Prevotella sp.]MCM1429769.1 4-hydroxy-tetrahydrodipicolinate reductase [Clostridium sp.]MCM1476061.1 4-hydroxy-tetrahydrodipicolinate reductase [Muribaculaceae bacterium]